MSHEESLERELDEMARENAELRRANDSFHDQIFEDDGYIDQIAALEKENANLKTTVEEDLLYIHRLEDAYADLLSGAIRLLIKGED